MSTLGIRPLAICVFHHDGRILVNEAFDEVKQQRYYRPLGGGIEFGERASEALVREIREEIEAEIRDLQLLGVLENIFTYNGAPGHEVVFVYDARLEDKSLYTLPAIMGRESNGQPFKAIWQSGSSFSAETPLYPDGLSSLLQSHALLCR